MNGRQIRTKIDTLVPSIPHLLQGRQLGKYSNAEDSEVVSKVEHHYTLGDPCYRAQSVNVRVIPRGPTWRRHLDQLRPRYGSDQDDDPCEIPTSSNQRKSEQRDFQKNIVANMYIFFCPNFSSWLSAIN